MIKKTIIITMVVVSLLIFFDIGEPVVSAEPVTIVIAGITFTVLKLAILIAVIMFCMAIMNQDIQDIVLPQLQDNIDTFWGKMRYIGESFVAWLGVGYNQSAIKLYVDDMSLMYDSPQALITAYWTGAEPLPLKDVVDIVRAFFSDMGINSTAIDAGYTTFRTYESSTIEIKDSSGYGDTLPFFTFGDLPYDYTVPTLLAASKNMSMQTLLEAGALELQGEWRNDDGTLSPPVSINVLPADDAYSRTEAFSIYLRDDLQIKLTVAWSAYDELMTHWVYWHEANQHWSAVGVDWIGVDYNDYYYIPTVGNSADNLRYYTLIGYNPDNGILYWFNYLVRIDLDLVLYVRKFPLNAEVQEPYYRFDNSSAVLADYVVNYGNGETANTIPNLDAPLDLPISDIFTANSLVENIDTGATEITSGETIDQILSDTIIDAIVTAYEGVTVETTVTNVNIDPNPEVPEKVKNFRLPALIITKFPFCLPWDLIALFELFNVPAEEELVFDLSFQMNFAGQIIDMPIVIDLEDYGIMTIAEIFRFFIFAGWIYFLISQSRKFTLS